MDTANYVLRQFNKQEQQEVEEDRSQHYIRFSRKIKAWFLLCVWFLQLDYTFQTGLEAIRIMLLEGFNKSATFVNTRKSMEQLS